MQQSIYGPRQTAGNCAFWNWEVNILSIKHLLSPRNSLSVYYCYLYGGLTGSKPRQVRVQDFETQKLGQIKKNQYNYYNIFCTIDTDLSMKYKQKFCYENKSPLVTLTS